MSSTLCISVSTSRSKSIDDTRLSCVLALKYSFCAVRIRRTSMKNVLASMVAGVFAVLVLYAVRVAYQVTHASEASRKEGNEHCHSEYCHHSVSNCHTVQLSCAAPLLSTFADISPRI